MAGLSRNGGLARGAGCGGDRLRNACLVLSLCVYLLSTSPLHRTHRGGALPTLHSPVPPALSNTLAGYIVAVWQVSVAEPCSGDLVGASSQYAKVACVIPGQGTDKNQTVNA